MEHDTEPHVMSDEGPVVAPAVTRAALQRSVGKLLFHAGFDEFQPSALDALTDMASDFFTKIVRDLGQYKQQPKIPETWPFPSMGEERYTSRFSTEEAILHSLHENGSGIEALESYVKDDVERTSGKLGVMHERMKAHLAELIRPALREDAGPDGAGAFNDDSEQFVGGDFAEDLDEDYLGLKALGLDKEFGLASLSVPLHLLQNRLHNANRVQDTR